MVIDRESPAFTARLDQTLAQLRETIEKDGCVIVPIIDGDFAYTVGLTERGHPELVAHGAPGMYAAGFLEELAGMVLRKGENISPPSLDFALSGDDAHILGVRPHDLGRGDPVLGMVVGIYGAGRPALMIDVMSCRCARCTLEMAGHEDA